MVQWLTESTPKPHPPQWTDWKTFQYVSRVHGVAPLLAQSLKDATWLDESLSRWLTEQYQYNQQRIAKMQAELQQILALPIPLMPLKGAILTATLYEPGVRPMADLDFLIRPEDFESALTRLKQLGYEPTVTHWKHIELSKPNNRQVISKTCEHPDNPRKLEIHQACRESFGGPTFDLTDFMWQNGYQGDLLGETTFLPTTEALWLHLLVHASYHLWQGRTRLIQLIDLVRLTPAISEPESLLNRFDKDKIRFTYPALAMLHKYFPTPQLTALLSEQKKQLSPAFQAWVASLDLVNSSYLTPSGLYFPKALKFTEGRPKEILQAFRFAFWPNLEEIVLDHPLLARSKIPWLAYFLLPWDWIRRLKPPK